MTESRVDACATSGMAAGERQGRRRSADAGWGRSSSSSTSVGEDVRHALLAEARSRRRADDERLASFRALSPREQAVLAGLLAGHSAETIAHRSYVWEPT